MANPTLPLDNFLDLLRGKGYGVGLHEHFAVARVLARWDRADAAELGDAVAALVGRTDEEVVAIRRLFDEFHAPAVAAGPTAPEGAETKRRRVPRGWSAVATLGVLLLLVALIWSRGGDPAPPVDIAPPPPASSADPAAIVEVAPPTPPPLPAPPSPVVRATLVQAAAASFVLALACGWAAKRKALHRQWLRNAWRAALGAMPGPYQYNVVVRGMAARLPRLDVEEAAVVLGRIFGAETKARDLDVRESLRLTLQRGMAPHLVFRRVRTARPIMVLQDISFEMEIWREKLEALLSDLRKQGVALERWYFDGDLRRVSEKSRGALMPLSAALGRRPDSPVLVLSAGGGLEAVVADPDGSWRRTLEGFGRRTWITPLVDDSLWPDALRRLDISVWPMTRRGLAHAARQLGGIDAPAATRLQVLAEGRVTEDGIERVKRLASLVPHPTPDLLELLRQRFAPDVPDAVLAHLMREANAHGLRSIRLPDDEVRRCVAAVRHETPRLEAAVRRQLLATLRDSEPARGSAAHLRWQLSVSLQELSLATLQKEDASLPSSNLRALQNGPLWEEVRSATRLDPLLASASSPTDGPPVSSRRGSPPADNGQLATSRPRPMAWPGVREAVAAVAAVLLVLAGGWQLGLFPTITLAHMENAYELMQAGTTGAPALTLRRVDDAAPATVNVYQDETVFRTGIVIPAGGSAMVDLPREAGHHYRARAELPRGNLATSNPVWVGTPDVVVVLIDAHPWARVTIQGGDTELRELATPVRVALRPGDYRLRLANDDLTPSLERQITVLARQPNQRFSFVMPGFDPAAAAAQAPGR